MLSFKITCQKGMITFTSPWPSPSKLEREQRTTQKNDHSFDVAQSFLRTFFDAGKQIINIQF
jgi:hypothetical protein